MPFPPVLEEQLEACRSLIQSAADDIKRISGGGELGFLQRLNGSVQDKLLSLTALLRKLDLEVEAADSMQESQALQDELRQLKNNHNALRPRLRSANLQAKQQAEKEARKESQTVCNSLFGGLSSLAGTNCQPVRICVCTGQRELLLGGGEEATLRRRKLQTQAEMAAAAEDVTDSFRRSRQIMAQEVQRGTDTLQTMEESNRQLKQTDDEYTKQRTVLGRTGRLLALLQRQDFQDRIIVIVGSILFLLACTYVLWKRLPIINRISISRFFVSKPPPIVGKPSPELLHMEPSSGSFPPPTGWLQPPGNPIQPPGTSSNSVPIQSPTKKSYLSSLQPVVGALLNLMAHMQKQASKLLAKVSESQIRTKSTPTNLEKERPEEKSTVVEPESLERTKKPSGSAGEALFLSGEDGIANKQHNLGEGDGVVVNAKATNVTNTTSNVATNLTSNLTSGVPLNVSTYVPNEEVPVGKPQREFGEDIDGGKQHSLGEGDGAVVNDKATNVTNTTSSVATNLTVNLTSDVPRNVSTYAPNEEAPVGKLQKEFGEDIDGELLKGSSPPLSNIESEGNFGALNTSSETTFNTSQDVSGSVETPDPSIFLIEEEPPSKEPEILPSPGAFLTDFASNDSANSSFGSASDLASERSGNNSVDETNEMPNSVSHVPKSEAFLSGSDVSFSEGSSDMDTDVPSPQVRETLKPELIEGERYGDSEGEEGEREGEQRDSERDGEGDGEREEEREGKRDGGRVGERELTGEFDAVASDVQNTGILHDKDINTDDLQREDVPITKSEVSLTTDDRKTGSNSHDEQGDKHECQKNGDLLTEALKAESASIDKGDKADNVLPVVPVGSNGHDMDKDDSQREEARTVMLEGAVVDKETSNVTNAWDNEEALVGKLQKEFGQDIDGELLKESSSPLSNIEGEGNFGALNTSSETTFNISQDFSGSVETPGPSSPLIEEEPPRKEPELLTDSPLNNHVNSSSGIASDLSSQNSGDDSDDEAKKNDLPDIDIDVPSPQVRETLKPESVEGVTYGESEGESEGEGEAERNSENGVGRDRKRDGIAEFGFVVSDVQSIGILLDKDMDKDDLQEKDDSIIAEVQSLITDDRKSSCNSHGEEGGKCDLQNDGGSLIEALKAQNNAETVKIADNDAAVVPAESNSHDEL